MGHGRVGQELHDHAHVILDGGEHHGGLHRESTHKHTVLTSWGTAQREREHTHTHSVNNIKQGYTATKRHKIRAWDDDTSSHPNTNYNNVSVRIFTKQSRSHRSLNATLKPTLNESIFDLSFDVATVRERLTMCIGELLGGWGSVSSCDGV